MSTLLPDWQIVYLGLGSNLGDRAGHLEKVRQKLEEQHLKIRRASQIYKTEPVELTCQPWFLNQVLEIETLYPPCTVLDICRTIEQRMGRQRIIDKGPRIIDLDILFYGGLRMESPSLILPHPRLHLRRFVLIPLSELIPAFIHPVLQASVHDLLRHCPDRASVELWG